MIFEYFPFNLCNRKEEATFLLFKRKYNKVLEEFLILIDNYIYMYLEFYFKDLNDLVLFYE